jgi:poly-gamma-glutamate synthesis protein (capsule biosynthesis protein)
VISNKGENVGSMYSFRADTRTLEGLIFAGFDVLSVANNHSMDYGIEALEDSVSRLERVGIQTAGLAVTKIKGTKIGFLGYTNLGSPLWKMGQGFDISWVDENTISEFQENVRITKEQSDILVVSVHFGEEYQKEPNEMQKLISKAAINAGADVVIGHHPHVVQPVEQYKNGWIAYSLGNFVFDQGFSPETMEGLLLEVTAKDKKITRVSPRIIHINSSFQPELP